MWQHVQCHGAPSGLCISALWLVTDALCCRDQGSPKSFSLPPRCSSLSRIPLCAFLSSLSVHPSLCIPLRLRAELEAQLVAEELAKRLDAYIEARVSDVMQSEAVQRELRNRLERERHAIEEQVRCTLVLGTLGAAFGCGWRGTGVLLEKLFKGR